MSAGYKIIEKDYSGALHGDDRIFLDADAAAYVYAQAKRRASNYAQQEFAPEVKMEKVEYQIVNLKQGRIGRVLHELDYRKRIDLVQQEAFQKLDAEEQRALGVSMTAKGIKLHGRPLPP